MSDTTTTTNGRATLRDIMELQQDMNDQLKDIRDDITALKVQNAKTSAIVALIVSGLTTVLVSVFMYFIKGFTS